jgi:hypothetical protein
VTYEHRDHLWSPVYIGRCESQQTKAGADQAILAPIVIDQPLAMVAAVVFDCQALVAIKQIWTA